MVTLCDPQTKSELVSRTRAYALTHSSRLLLQSLQIWEELREDLNGFDKLCIEDRELNQRVLFKLQDLSPANRSSGSVGWILDHQPLMNLLMQRIEGLNTIQLQLGNSIIADAHQVHDLTIAADGSQSPARKSWGIGTWTMNYNQGCLTAKVLLRGAESRMAYESFRTEGPLAVLPLGGEHYQVVWSAPLRRCQQLAAMTTSAFLDQLATVLPMGIEVDALLDTPKAFAQRLQLARQLTRGRSLLIGEAAHRCHPIGGQGLNLCWRDVSTLISLIDKVVEKRIPLKKLPKIYAQRRWVDLIIVSVTTDFLLRIFSSRHLINLIMRKPMLLLLNNFPSIRGFCLHMMTNGLQANPTFTVKVSHIYR